jgi:photosystem II stability/assembly factor-like uncharacterized protein
MIGDNVRSFSFADPRHGWVATGLGWEDYYDYGLLSTSDGGNTWQVVSTENGLSGQLNFVTKNFGYRLGWPGTVHVSPELQRTVDAGLSWATIYRPKPFGETLQSFQFLDFQNGFLMSYQLSFSSTVNGGGDWQALPLPADGSGDAGFGPFDFINPNTGWLVTYNRNNGDISQVLKTEDAEENWESVLQGNAGLDEKFEFPHQTTDLDFLDANFGWLVGDSQVYATEDSGVTWKKLDLSLGFINSIQLLWGGRAFALVSSGFPTRAPALMKSTDGGKTWVQVYPPLAPWFWELYDPDLAYGVGTAYDVSAVLRSRDGGRTWQQIASLGSEVLGPHAVHFITPQEGWITAQVSLGHQSPIVLFHTTDGGLTWALAEEYIPEGLPDWGDLNNNVEFVDKMLGFSSDNGQLWKTEDGGLSFNLVTTK